jgi:hypothetical protein
MLRATTALASLSIALLASACALDDDAPQTSPGELNRVRDVAYECDDSATDTSWACSIELTLAGNELSSVGIHNDGSANGPRAVATLSDTAVADLNALIATVPMKVEDGVGGVSCGLAPIASRTYTIDFDTVGVRDLEFHAAEYGPLLELKNRVTGFITAIDTCTANESITFSSCSPRIARKQ